MAKPFSFSKIITYFARNTINKCDYVQKKKILKWSVGIVLTPILLFTILAVLLYLPPVQNWLVKQVTAYASKQTGMEISVERVKLVFPLDLGVEGFKMIQQNDSLPQVKDTIADVKQLVVNVQLWPLLKKQVEIDALEFNDVKLNTADFVHEARVKGSIGRLYLQSHGIDLGKESVKVNEAILADAKMNVELSDTVPRDTSTAKNNWKIYVDKLNIKNTGITVHTPGDTLQIAAHLGKTEARNGHLDLYSGTYKIQRLDWTEGTLAYDNNFETHVKGLDPNHIALSDVVLGIDSLYFCSPDLKLSLRACSFKEKSGITLSSLTGPIAMDSVNIYLPAVNMKTPDSYLSARFIMALNAFDDRNPGEISLHADAAIGKQDIMRFIGDMPTSFIRRWPNQPLAIKAAATGNMKNLRLGGISIKLPTAFNINASGTAGNVTDVDHLRASVKLDARTYNLGFITELLKAQGTPVTIPGNIGMKGNVNVNGKRYQANLTVSEGGGRLKANGHFDAARMSYAAKLVAENVKISHFMPGNDLGDFSGSLTVNGRGTDFMSPHTSLTAEAGV